MLVYARGCCPIEFEIRNYLEYKGAWTSVLRCQVRRLVSIVQIHQSSSFDTAQEPSPLDNPIIYLRFTV